MSGLRGAGYVTYLVGTARLVPLAGDMWDPVYEAPAGHARAHTHTQIVPTFPLRDHDPSHWAGLIRVTGWA